MSKARFLRIAVITVSLLIVFIVLTSIGFSSAPEVSEPDYRGEHERGATSAPYSSSPAQAGSTISVNTPSSFIKYDSDQPTEPAEPEPEPEPEPQPPPFEPYAIEDTLPDKMIASTAIMADGQITEKYISTEEIDFGFGHEYALLEGVLTFRGNNFRDTASFGQADIRNAKFGDSWYRSTGNITTADGTYWSGHGWTGQPLIAKWPLRARGIMNMYDWAKEQEELVEVVYPAMDGNVYFTELETGKPTRDTLFLGYTFKGSGALDPRGYPLLYVGAGFEGASGQPRILIVSLVDGSVLLTFGGGDSFAPRAWYAADASPLVDARTDTLIYPSESGTIYIIKLNSVYDLETGSVFIEPNQAVKWRFNGKRSHAGGKYWLGFEASPVIWRGHLIIADNGGHLICLDLNTLELVWVQDTLDDTNCTPVLALEGDHPYIYISTSFHGGWRAPLGATAAVPIWKIDAVTGAVVWRKDYDCYTDPDASGGVQGTIAVGRYDLNGLIFVPMARTPTVGAGVLTAIDRNSGEAVWEFETRDYSWSSPVCIYDQNGKGYVIHCTSGGYMYLLDGFSGDVLDSVSLGGLIEASPAVYGNTIIIGTRVMRIWGVALN